MEVKYWREYNMLPSGEDEEIARRFNRSMDLIRTFERFELVDVKVSTLGRPHDVVTLWVDGVWYDEEISVWIKRFGRR